MVSLVKPLMWMQFHELSFSLMKLDIKMNTRFNKDTLPKLKEDDVLKNSLVITQDLLKTWANAEVKGESLSF